MADNSGLSFEKLSEVVKTVEPDSREVRLSLGVVDYDAPYLLHYDVSLHLYAGADAKRKVFDFLSRIDMLTEASVIEQKKD